MMIKLGTNTAILGNYTLEQVIDFAASIGLSSLEVACWPPGQADRRYAGVTHIDVDRLTETRIGEIRSALLEKKLTIGSLSYSPNRWMRMKMYAMRRSGISGKS